MQSTLRPRFRHAAFAIWARNMLVLRKMMGPSIVINLGEPLLYMVGLGFGLGLYIGGQMDMPYLTFLASGFLAASAMNTATFEALFGVFTRMVPQKSYDAMLASPIEIADILAGESLVLCHQERDSRHRYPGGSDTARGRHRLAGAVGVADPVPGGPDLRVAGADHDRVLPAAMPISATTRHW